MTPKKERWLCAFLNSFTSPVLLFLLLLHYSLYLYCIAFAAVVGLLLYPITPPVGAFLFSLLSYLIDGCPDIKGIMKQMKRNCCPVLRSIYCRLCEAS
jgi:hypothetical protein